MNVKVFRLISVTNEARCLILKWECKCRWDESIRDDHAWNPSTCDCGCNKVFVIDDYLNTKKFSCKKHTFGQLVLACNNEVLNAAQTSHDDKKVAC